MTDKPINPQSDKQTPPAQDEQVVKPVDSPAVKPSESGQPAVKSASDQPDKEQPAVKSEAASPASSPNDETLPNKPKAANGDAPASKAPASPSPAVPGKNEISTNRIADEVVASALKRTGEQASAKAETTGAPAAPKADASGTPAAPKAEQAPKSDAGSVPAVPKPEPAPKSAASAPAAPKTEPTGAPSSQPTSAIQVCPNCAHSNRAGVIFCENCGTNLLTGKQPSLGTRDLMKEKESLEKQSETTKLNTSESQAIKSAGSSVFTDDMVLRIEIEGGLTPMLVFPKVEIIFGRRDPSSGNQPDVDMTAYAGYRMGVSRRHAALRLHDRRLDVSDLGSSNGTFLNGQRLEAHQPYQVRDGDELRLGQMVLKLFFQSGKP
ncbi:MAG: FHA domain-containing protein [Anaerolineae bacterium]|nr:FHA domain-containing protein [Anaerolineae bacterium]